MLSKKVIPDNVRTPKGFPGPSKHFKETMRQCSHCNNLLLVEKFCDCSDCVAKKCYRRCSLVIASEEMKLCDYCKEYTLFKDFCKCGSCESSDKDCCWECCKEMTNGEKQDHADYFSSIRGTPPESF